jgi:hypothetical protein
VSLSAAEAALLQSLLKRPNKILTREQLIGERELDPFDRSIDVRISRLRRKLEDDPQDPKIIKTVRRRLPAVRHGGVDDGVTRLGNGKWGVGCGGSGPTLCPRSPGPGKIRVLTKREQHT